MRGAGSGRRQSPKGLTLNLPLVGMVVSCRSATGESHLGVEVRLPGALARRTGILENCVARIRAPSAADEGAVGASQKHGAVAAVEGRTAWLRSKRIEPDRAGNPHVTRRTRKARYRALVVVPDAIIILWSAVRSAPPLLLLRLAGSAVLRLASGRTCGFCAGSAGQAGPGALLSSAHVSAHPSPRCDVDRGRAGCPTMARGIGNRLYATKSWRRATR
jgi:hypothetical protein